jgi:hypothetical protein
MGRYAETRKLDEDSFTRRRRVRGADHIQTLDSASNFALDLYFLGGGAGRL